METITKSDIRYPPLLIQVQKSPEKLFVQGNSDLLGERMMVVVGSRKVSRDGVANAKKVVRRLVDDGYVVVSGLARGVDTVVHGECLKLGGKTIAVLAHGLDMIYPSENKKLSRDIVASGGASVSQLEVGVKPERYYFPLRNRLMVGMSLGVVVVEADIGSGTMTTASWAGELDRSVWVVRGSNGCELLLQEGAREWGR